MKNGIWYGKLYLKLPNGEKDVSEIMIEMGKAYNSNSINQLINATESSDSGYVEVVRTSGEAKNEMVQLSVPKENSKSDADSSSSVTPVSDKTVIKLGARVSDEESSDSDWVSKIMSVCSDDSVKTEEIAETTTLAPINRGADRTKGISSCGDIPAYLLEDNISEIGAEKYSIPRNSNPFRQMDMQDEAADMQALLKDAKGMNNSFKLRCIHNVQQHSRLMFHYRIAKHFKQMRSHDPNHVQEQMWSIISKETHKKIHIVGDTHYIMYLPAICDSIYVCFSHSSIVNNRLFAL